MIINNSSLVFVIETKKGRSKRSEYKEGVSVASIRKDHKETMGFLTLSQCKQV